MAKRLEDRPLTDRLCECGCGRFARERSHINSQECKKVWELLRIRAAKKKFREKCAMKEMDISYQSTSWESRRKLILEKYGIKKEGKFTKINLEGITYD